MLRRSEPAGGWRVVQASRGGEILARGERETELPRTTLPPTDQRPEGSQREST